MYVYVYVSGERLEVSDSLAGVTDGGEALMLVLEVNLSPLKSSKCSEITKPSLQAQITDILIFPLNFK